MRRTLLAALCVLAVPAPALAQRSSAGDSTFSWEGQIPEGSWIKVRSLNGDVSVEPGDGNVTRVRGEKQWRRGDPSEVRFEVFRDGSNVVICALWHEEATCDEDGAHYPRDRERRGDRNNDVSVDFTVVLPRGVKVDVGTVNGGLDVRGASSEVEAHTVNGRVEASTLRGPVNASTVNGSIRVRMDALEGTDALEYSTVNGSITVELPANFQAEVDMSTVNGGVRLDFPVTVSGRMSPRRLRGTIGGGGRRVKLSTVNGSIELRKLS
ncbi:MAG: DUF4097 family beta strand repeat-containing protein [Gemmatimonadaceae bacterium]